mmetsp:Transcript_5787/g.8874  ORF Transcript_5787/g.8874 Transcript_5787/m.8874 type:complete len:170 (-) Transcript_5787:289-798(-)|eukprot:CAMPEP_0178937764 /NCGR_PEP_ID=MMETSP0786-20121207/25949_1 /TAXON_ID=186022 /ORGANISM="Thalassionema frauenfeldii, Strain CCMP 1798" /LENGTH=169 /DNA_ID=CAMNT_0020616393 /DNA_START=334 /DNA_END=843 /DNA_ORIENTATION=-
MTVTFRSLVKEEFGKDFNVQWISTTSVNVDYKANPDDLTACCCPGLVQKYNYTLTLQTSGGRPQVNYRDNIAGTFNRMQGGMAAGAGNASQVNAVQRMNNLVLQRCSRIESHLIAQQTKTSSPVEQVKSEVMEERDGMAAEIAKLKKLHDDGVLDDEEFKQAKAKVISS